MTHQTRAQTVTDILRERILDGQIAPACHLYEVQLTQELKVSRTPIRAALNTLAKEGLLEYLPNRGYAVRRFEAKDLVDAFEARATLEALACRLVATAGLSKAALSRMRDSIARGDRILAKGRLETADLPPYRELNVEFHETILEECGNRWIVDLVHRSYRIPYVSDRVIFWSDYSILLRSHDDHHRILRAIEAGQAWRAEALMREHIHFAGECFQQVIHPRTAATLTESSLDHPAVQAAGQGNESDAVIVVAVPS
jgi:GntR family transcriptional regulator of vanillate catabolism